MFNKLSLVGRPTSPEEIATSAKILADVATAYADPYAPENRVLISEIKQAGGLAKFIKKSDEYAEAKQKAEESHIEKTKERRNRNAQFRKGIHDIRDNYAKASRIAKELGKALNGNYESAKLYLGEKAVEFNCKDGRAYPKFVAADPKEIGGKFSKSSVHRAIDGGEKLLRKVEDEFGYDATLVVKPSGGAECKLVKPAEKISEIKMLALAENGAEISVEEKGSAYRLSLGIFDGPVRKFEFKAGRPVSAWDLNEAAEALTKEYQSRRVVVEADDGSRLEYLLPKAPTGGREDLLPIPADPASTERRKYKAEVFKADKTKLKGRELWEVKQDDTYDKLVELTGAPGMAFLYFPKEVMAAYVEDCVKRAPAIEASIKEGKHIDLTGIPLNLDAKLFNLIKNRILVDEKILEKYYDAPGIFKKLPEGKFVPKGYIPLYATGVMVPDGGITVEFSKGQVRAASYVDKTSFAKHVRTLA